MNDRLNLGNLATGRRPIRGFPIPGRKLFMDAL